MQLRILSIVLISALGASHHQTAEVSGGVFVSTPNAYRAVGPFWRAADTARPLSFALARDPAGTELTFIHASDTHISHVPATHPLYGRAMYHHYFGPDYYSFTRGGVHFVGLNTVDIDDQQYFGHVDSLQLAWLERDLALVPASMPIVTFDHIPFFTTIEGLNGYNDQPPAPSLITVKGKTAYRHSVSNAGDVLALGGHMHATERIEYEMTGGKTRFNQVSAVVGPSTGAGLESIPGVTLYHVKNGEIDAGRFIRLDSSR